MIAPIVNILLSMKTLWAELAPLRRTALHFKMRARTRTLRGVGSVTGNGGPYLI